MQPCIRLTGPIPLVDSLYIPKIAEVDRSGKESVLLGTVYKEMKLKPNVLDEFSKEVREVTLRRSVWLFTRLSSSASSRATTLARKLRRSG